MSLPVNKRLSVPFIALWLMASVPGSLKAQRTYHASSVLATGAWYKIAVKEAGVYKIDLPLLRALGITAPSIPSAALRLFGNGGQMLPESCNGPVTDDLQENPLQVNDGGDGILNGSDYALFFVPGPHRWKLDAASGTFLHQKNLYSDQAFYFLTLGGTGKRMSLATVTGTADREVTSFDEHYFHELDTVNLLSSGKSWYGEDFSASAATRSFPIPLPGLLPGRSFFRSSCIARSIGSSSRFSVSVNNTPVLTHLPAPTGAGNLDLFAAASGESAGFVLNNPTAQVIYAFQSSALGAQGWLDWFEFQARRSLSLAAGGQLLFRDLLSLQAGASARFQVQGAIAATQVWDVSDPLMPYQLSTSLSGSGLQFVNDCSTLHEYIAFSGSLTPAALGRVSNQNLHALPAADMFIVCHPAVYEQAMRLAAYHTSRDHLKIEVVNISLIYNEFASGSPDPVALRDFVKMFYDRAGSNAAGRPRYLLLFGDASYDYRNRLRNNTNLVPAYESTASADPLATYTSDDFYGFLDDREDIGADSAGNLLDLGIGRVPVATSAQARAYVDKVIQYTDTATMGAWRNHLTYVADDEDFNLHLQDAETVAATADTVNRSFLPVKVYLDAYPQESTASGNRYPAVNEVINEGINRGTLIWNYSGHGSASRLAEEVALDPGIAASWSNAGKLPLFITATCDFAPYDNPANYSLGEDLLLREKTGAIALMTTTRPVFANSNRIINQNYMRVALQQKPDGSYCSLGEAVMKAKNDTYQTFSDRVNNRKFTLLGDPALTLAFPKYQVQTSTVNGRPVVYLQDTLKALQECEVGGQVTDAAGAVVAGFNGTVSVTVFDKADTVSTRANDAGSLRQNFQVQNTVLYKGVSDVRNGLFTCRFVVPKDIGYRFGPGLVSYYAKSPEADGNGGYTGFVTGGSQAGPADLLGPTVQAFLDSPGFSDGSETGQSPVLLVRLSDPSGINIVGTAIGHDLTARLDDSKEIGLNPYFDTDPNSFRQGSVRYPFYDLAEGPHTLRVKAWDGANNSTEVQIRFTVVRKKRFNILQLVNYPNPVFSGTLFHFSFDAAVRRMEVSVTIFTAEGRLIKAIKKTINTNGSRFGEIEWDGKDETGAKPPKGVYFYRIVATTDIHTSATGSGNLLIW